METGHRLAWTPAIAWLALSAFSAPILLDLARHIAAHSWTWYALAFPPLCILTTLRMPRRRPRVGFAILSAAFGAAIAIMAMASGELRLGRVGVALCVLAVLLLQGRASLRASLLLALCLPVPTVLLDRASGPLLNLVAQALATLSRWRDLSTFSEGSRVERPDGSFQLMFDDIGWTTAVLAFGLTWYLHSRAASSFTRSLSRSSIAAVGGLVGHAIVTLAVFSWTGSEHIEAIRPDRDLLAYCLAILGAVLVAHRHRHRESRDSIRRPGDNPTRSPLGANPASSD